jgi:hypothetical protein
MPSRLLSIYKLYAKILKYKFVCRKVVYMDHIVLEKGVKVYPKKVETMV